MKFTTKQRNFLIAPSLSHLFVYSHRVMFHILAEEGKWGDFLSEPLRDDGVWLVRQCNEVPPVPKSIVTVRRRKTVTKLPALSTKHPVQTCLSKLVDNLAAEVANWTGNTLCQLHNLWACMPKNSPTVLISQVSTAVLIAGNVHSCAQPKIYGKKLCWLLKLC